MKNTLLLAFTLLFLLGCKKDDQDDFDGNEVTTVSFSIPADSVKLNPSGNAPLSALLNFTSPVSGYTEIVVKGKKGDGSSISQTFTDAGTFHSIPVIGLYADYDNEVNVVVVDEKGNRAEAIVTIKTGPLSGNLPTYINVDQADYDKMEGGVNLVSSFSGYPEAPLVPYIVDNYGDIRWYLDFTDHPELKNLFYDCGISRLRNGNFYFADQKSGKIYEVDVLGKIANTWNLSGYTFHHEVFEKPDGNFLVTVSKPGSTHTNGSPTVEDYIIEIDRNNGNITNTWDFKESLDEYRTAWIENSEDWIHINAVTYDPSDNTIIVSGRHQGLFKLTYDNNVKWIMASHRGWGKNRRGQDLNQYLLTPVNKDGNAITDAAVLDGSANHPDFEWNWCQHSPVILPNGSLMLFDNGDLRNYSTETGSRYSRAVEYAIDESKMTVQQKWDYGKERKEDTFAQFVSSVEYLGNKKNVLFCPGVRVPNATGAGGKVVEVNYDSREVVFQLSISSPNDWGFHRVKRIPMYPNGNPYK